MGVTLNTLGYILKDIKKRGKYPGGALLTLGRQTMGFTTVAFNDFLARFNYDKQIEEDIILFDELVFKTLGFDSVDSLDYSNYENASFVYDLNDENLPSNLQSKFDYVLDGGTLEHVFNIPNALTVIHKLLKTFGTYIFELPMHSHDSNHGLYNFSPGLFDQYFKANNYEINSINPYFYTVTDTFPYFYCYYLETSNLTDVSVPARNPYDAEGMILGSVTKTNMSTCNIIPCQASYANAWELAAVRHKNEVLDSCLKSAPDKSAFLYGTGRHTKDMLPFFPNKYRSKIKGLLDNDDSRIGETVYGYMIYDIEDIVKGDTIIISSMHQDIIYDRLRHLGDKGINIIKLYK